MELLIIASIAFGCVGLYSFYGIFAADTISGSLQCLLLTILIYGGIALFWYLFKMFAKEFVKTDTYKRMEEKEQAEISLEYDQAVQSQQSDTPWAVRYATYPCPHCGHYKVRCANWEDKRLSVAFWGAASNKIGKTYKCEHCNRMW